MKISPHFSQGEKCILPGKIGCVPYLNSRPLIFGIEKWVRFDVPSVLARALRQGELDVALAPVTESFEHSGYRILPGMAIGCRGPVRSVYLVHRAPIANLKTVALDPASQTSNLLLRVVLAEFFGLSPRYEIPSSADPASFDAQLQIGDPALRAREQWAHQGFHLLDLGELWWEQTQLPFVFAFWALRETMDPSPWIKLLTEAKTRGIENIDQMIATQNVAPADMARSYLTRCIRYDLGEQELKGIAEFQRLCVKHGFLARTADLRLAG